MEEAQYREDGTQTGRRRFCTRCGAPLADDAHFCKRCGAEASRRGTTGYAETNARVAGAVRRLQHGDETAFDVFFNDTRGYVATIVRLNGVPASYQDDVMQAVYLKAYRHIGSVRELDKAIAWIKQVAVNESRSFLSRQGNELAAIPAEPLTPEELEGARARDVSVDSDMQLPENVAEDRAMRQVLLGFVDELPQEQRDLFLRHYLAELSSAEIARETGESESTVRSRLMRTRRKLQERVDEYARETKTELRRGAVAPLLWLLLRDRTAELVAASGISAQTVLAQAHATLHGSGASATQASAQQASGAGVSTADASSGAASRAGRAGWLSLHRRLVAVFVAVAVGAGAAGAIVAGVLHSGQGQDEAAGEEQPAAGQDATVDAVVVAEAYGQVLDDVVAGRYDFSNPAEPDLLMPDTSYAKDCSCAVQDIDGDGIPELLVQCVGYNSKDSSAASHSQRNMLAFTYRADQGVVKLDGVVTFHMATTGSHRIEYLYTKAGNGGIYKRAYTHNGYIVNDSGEQTTDALPGLADGDDPRAANTYGYTILTVQGDSLVETDLGHTFPDDVEYNIVRFTPISDRSALGLTGGQTGQDAGQEDDYSSKVAAARAAGQTVYEGTLQEMTISDFLDLQVETGDWEASQVQELRRLDSGYGTIDWNEEMTVLVFDDATEVTARSGDGQGSMTRILHSMLLNHDSWDSFYYGRRIALGVDSYTQGQYSGGISESGLDPVFDLSPSDIVALY